MNAAKHGELLKQLREKKKWSLREFARRSDISHAYLSQLENGLRDRPKVEMLRVFADTLEVDYVSLLIAFGVLSDEDVQNYNGSKGEAENERNQTA